WQQLRPAVHVSCGVMVALSGALSALFVTLVNAWMNTPCCLEEVDPLKAMATPFAFHEVVHGTPAAYMATAFARIPRNGFFQDNHILPRFLLRELSALLFRAVGVTRTEPSCSGDCNVVGTLGSCVL